MGERGTETGTRKSRDTGAWAERGGNTKAVVRQRSPEMGQGAKGEGETESESENERARECREKDRHRDGRRRERLMRQQTD